MNWDQLLKEKGPVTAQQISDFEHMRRDERENLTLFQQPLTTLRIFFAGCVALASYAFRYVVSHALFLYLVLPAVLLWLVLDHIPGPYTDTISQIEFAVEYVVWWVGLGILSSIGLGSGLQSGVLFLFPHIMKVSLAAHTCQTLDFDSMSDMWFRSPPSLFHCPVSNGSVSLASPGTPVTLWGIWRKIILVCFLQSAGTAIGEIPPYWMTRAARLAAIEANDDPDGDLTPETIHSAINSSQATSNGTINDARENQETDGIPEELETNSPYGIVNKAKLFMIWFLRTHGFLGVLIMASYPNIAFDLCGICCGHFLMPFWTFFGATFLGKAVVRNSYQSIIYVMLCSEEYLELLILVLQQCSPDQLHLDQMIREVLEEARNGFKTIGTATAAGGSGGTTNSSNRATAKVPSSASGSLFSVCWRVLVTVLLTAFVLSCIGHFAQYYQMQLDQQDSEKLRLRLPSKVREALVSPSTGRLKLPPPTPGTVTGKGKKGKLGKTAPPSSGIKMKALDGIASSTKAAAGSSIASSSSSSGNSSGSSANSNSNSLSLSSSSSSSSLGGSNSNSANLSSTHHHYIDDDDNIGEHIVVRGKSSAVSPGRGGRYSLRYSSSGGSGGGNRTSAGGGGGTTPVKTREKSTNNAYHYHSSSLASPSSAVVTNGGGVASGSNNSTPAHSSSSHSSSNSSKKKALSNKKQ